MKIRIGLGARASTEEELSIIAEAAVDLGFDSLWLAESITGPLLDPLVGLSWVGATRPTLKLGTTIVFPGRSPIHFAKELASLDRLSKGRLLVTVVPGQIDTLDVGTGAKERASAIDEAIPIVRALLAGQAVSYDNQFGHVDNRQIAIRPVQDPFEFWLGGLARSSLERCGRLFDGWLPSRCSVDRAAQGREIVADAAKAAGRTISEEHFGVSIVYTHEPLDWRDEAAVLRRSGGDRVDRIVPMGLQQLRERLEQFTAVGFSKFVIRPIKTPASWEDELERLFEAVGSLQT